MKKLRGYVKNKEAEIITVVASTSSKDRMGESINADGWLLDNFKKNPVLLWAHRADQLPIGRVLKVYTEGNSLIAETAFADHPFAREVEKMVKGGFINAVSVGFKPEKYDETDASIVKEQTLLELSYVNVPANEESLVTREYKDFKASAKEFEKAEKFNCECIKCGHKMVSEKHCKDIKCPKCEGKMRRQERPGPGKDEDEEKENKQIEELKKIISEMEVKEGRILSQQNRKTMSVAIDAMHNAVDILKELLMITEPPEKKGAKHISVKRPSKRLRALRLIDKAVEGLISEEKNGGEKDEN